MKCDKCLSDNVTEKYITSKKNGQKYLVYECQNGCMNGKWKYSCFPPKGHKAPQQPQQPDMLTTINQKLDMILTRLQTNAVSTIRQDDPKTPF